MREHAFDILNLIWPALGGMITLLLAALTFIGKRIVGKIDELCRTLRDVMGDISNVKKDLAVMQMKCKIYHEDDE